MAEKKVFEVGLLLCPITVFISDFVEAENELEAKKVFSRIHFKENGNLRPVDTSSTATFEFDADPDPEDLKFDVREF